MRLPFLASFVLTAVALQAAEPADLEHGRTLFVQSCALCHAGGAGTTAGQGPSLVGVIGRTAATVPGFNYTKALQDSRLVWDAATLDRYIANPTLAVPGTVMVIAVPAEKDRRDIIAYLGTLKADPAATAAPVPTISPEAANDPRDWRHASPGTNHRVDVNQLAAPFATVSTRNNSAIVPRPTDAKLAVPAGFSVQLFAEGLNGPRLLRLAPNGDLFIAETRANRVRVLRPSADGSKPAADELFAEGLDRPFGVTFYPAGDNPQWVYVANNNSIVRFPYRSGDLKARAAAEVVVPKLSETTNGHSTRDVAFSLDGRRMFIAVGSGSNFAEGLPRKSPEEVARWEAEHGLGAAWDFEFHRANILTTDPEGKAPLKVFASGIRNPVGLAVNPITGDLWTSTNERDGLGDDLVPDYVTRVKEHAFYGWPWYYMGKYEEPRHKGFRPDLAGKATAPDVPLQAHSASLGIVFYPAGKGAGFFPAEYQGDLFVALHGSWNRASRTGYKVVRARMKNGIPTGEYQDFVTGFVVDARNVWGRPVGVAVAKDGSLLISEDGNGSIWRVTPSAGR
jgi:glucose/arabinose dehydrogenase